MAVVSNLVKGIGGMFGDLVRGPKTPAAPEPVLPPTTREAAGAGDMARRAAAGTGRSSTILTGELGVSDTGGAARKRLLGGG